MDWVLMPIAAEATGQGGGGSGQIVHFVVLIGAMLVFFYFILIRPQKKQEERRREMINALSKGDRVITIGGIMGTVAEISEDTITLKVDNQKDVQMKFRKSAVAGLQKDKKEEAPS